MRNVAARLNRLEVVRRAALPTRLEVEPFEDPDGHRWVRVRYGADTAWKAIDRDAWEAV